jgi:hypothetical protein
MMRVENSTGRFARLNSALNQVYAVVMWSNHETIISSRRIHANRVTAHALSIMQTIGLINARLKYYFLYAAHDRACLLFTNTENGFTEQSHIGEIRQFQGHFFLAAGDSCKGLLMERLLNISMRALV